MKVCSWLVLGLVAVFLVGCPKPVITAQPMSRIVNPGNDVSFTVAAKNADAFGWKKDGQPIPSEFDKMLKLAAVTEKDQGSYQATAKNGSGHVDSEVATLMVNDPVVITTQPMPQTVNMGSPATIAVTASGTLPLSYQWYRNGQSVSGGTAQTLAIASAKLIDIGSYYCLVNNVVNQAANSNEATLRLNGYPAQGIAFTRVPEYDTFDNLYGVAYGVNPAEYKVVVQNESTWGYWVKETVANPNTFISSGVIDGLGSNYVCDVTTGANDEKALGYVAELMPIGVDPILCTGNNGGWGGVPCPTEPNTPGAIDKCVVHRLEMRTIEAFGLVWDVKFSEFPIDPGQHPYSNSESDVFVDGDGYIHLISRATTSVEIVSQQSFGYGTYIFQVQGLAELLDINRTLGLFVYELLGSDPAHREIDILELAMWGDLLNPTNAQYVLQPCSNCPGCANCIRFSLDETSDFTTYMVWSPGHLEMRTYWGNHLDGVPPFTNLVAQWVHDGTDVPEPSVDQKVRANLWLLSGKNPATVTDQEVVLTGFAHQAEAPWVGGIEPAVTVGASATDVTIGDQVTFTATASGSEPISYQWSKDDLELSGQIGETLVISSAQLDDAGDYACVATNAFGAAESAPVHLAVSPPDPVIDLQPLNQVKNPGEDVTFGVIATGGLAPLEYQWYKKVGADSNPITSATSSILMLHGVTEADEAGYWCRVTNAVGPVKIQKVANPS